MISIIKCSSNSTPIIGFLHPVWKFKNLWPDCDNVKMSCEILGETPCEKQDNGNNKKSKRNNWEINVEVTRTTVWTEAGPDSVSSCVRDLSLALCALFLNITWQAVWQEQCNFTMPVCSHPSQCVYRERNRKCVCSVEHVTCIDVQRYAGTLCEKIQARKAFHHEHAHIKQHTDNSR